MVGSHASFGCVLELLHNVDLSGGHYHAVTACSVFCSPDFSNRIVQFNDNKCFPDHVAAAICQGED